MNPKPLHIGDVVYFKFEDGTRDEGARVTYAADDFVEVLYRNGDRTTWSHYNLVHEDGSPLGEWEPIRFDGKAVFHADITGLAAISVHDANRIIRGEVEQ